MNKKAVELNVATIIIVILAILVLVILALYFTGGMKSLWDQITGKKAAWDTTAIEDAKTTCAFYCSSNNPDLFCHHQFQIGRDENGNPVMETCVGDKIKAYDLNDCKEAGFTKEICGA